MSNGELLVAFVVVVLFVVFIIREWMTTRSIAALIAALEKANNNQLLIEQGHKLATEVIPASSIPDLLNALFSVKELVKNITDDQGDRIADLIEGLAEKFLVLNSGPEGNAVPKSEDSSLTQP